MQGTHVLGTRWACTPCPGQALAGYLEGMGKWVRALRMAQACTGSFPTCHARAPTSLAFPPPCGSHKKWQEEEVHAGCVWARASCPLHTLCRCSAHKRRTSTAGLDRSSSCALCRGLLQPPLLCGKSAGIHSIHWHSMRFRLPEAFKALLIARGQTNLLLSPEAKPICS